jgi:hypothetical protein
VGVRRRQLGARTLLVGALLALADGRPAHMTRVLAALRSLSPGDKERLGVVEDREGRPHELTYRQTEHTFAVLGKALGKGAQGGRPSELAGSFCDAMLEATVPGWAKETSRSLAVDWTDVDSYARPPLHEGAPCADADASWGHRRGDGPGQADELFFGYYLSIGTMVHDEAGPTVPELARRATLGSCHVDPVPEAAGQLEAMPAQGAPLGDVLADCGYSLRVPEKWAARLRRAGAQLVMDLHPNDRGPKGTFEGAVLCNGNLYCPRVPKALLELGPLARGATEEQVADHDARSAELARYKLGRACADDADGYHRVECPAVMGKLRCPLRPPSMALPHDRPEVLSPPEHPQKCCVQKTLTVPPTVNAKTAQKHDWGSPAWRSSYARRSAAERTNSTIKDPASNDISRGWCRVMGLAPMFFFLTCCLVVRNFRVLDAFEARQAEDQRRAAAGLAPRRRRRRRRATAARANAVPAKAPP